MSIHQLQLRHEAKLRHPSIREDIDLRDPSDLDYPPLPSPRINDALYIISIGGTLDYETTRRVYEAVKHDPRLEPRVRAYGQARQELWGRKAPDSYTEVAA